MQYAVSGSFAYDVVLSHAGKFQERILPNEIKKLNVSFDIEYVERHFGGTAGNIAYNASLLGDKPNLIGAVGVEDGNEYITRLQNRGLNCALIARIPDALTASVIILTDASGNQISMFHPGAMRAQPSISLKTHLRPTPQLMHIAPDDPDRMMMYMREAAEIGLPYFIDPGQVLPQLMQFSGFKEAVAKSAGLFLNEYEATLLEHSIGSLRGLVNSNAFIVVTKGKNGATLHVGSEQKHFRAIDHHNVCDPTGCGDAFRAGFLHSYCNAPAALESAMKLGIVMASFAIEGVGGQSHAPSLHQILSRSLSYSPE